MRSYDRNWCGDWRDEIDCIRSHTLKAVIKKKKKKVTARRHCVSAGQALLHIISDDRQPTTMIITITHWNENRWFLPTIMCGENEEKVPSKSNWSQYKIILLILLPLTQWTKLLLLSDCGPREMKNQSIVCPSFSVPHPTMKVNKIASNPYCCEFFRAISMNNDDLCVCVRAQATIRHIPFPKDREILSKIKIIEIDAVTQTHTLQLQLQLQCDRFASFRCVCLHVWSYVCVGNTILIRFLIIYFYRCRNTFKRFSTSGIKSTMKYGPKLLYSKVIAV